MDNNESERRELRRKKRIKNQLIAYLVLLVLLAGIGIGGYFGVTRVMTIMSEYDEKVNTAIKEAEEKAIADDVESVEESTIIEESEPVSEEVVEEVVTEEADPLDEYVDSIISSMTLEEKVAGLFIVSPESITGVGTAIVAGDATKKAIEENPVGGIIYRTKNFQSKTQFAEMTIKSIGYSKYPLFTVIDRECGNDTSFGIVSTEKESVLIDKANVNVAYSLLSSGLDELNINMVISPVADIVSEDGNKELQGRCFGSDGETIAPLLSKAVETLQEKRNCVVKTFPGEGSVNNDRELIKSSEELRNAELLAFAGAVNSNASSIMVSNLYATGIAGEKIPACFSKEVIELLRNELNYSGIIMTDYLDENIITSGYNAKEAGVLAIKAGADMLLSPKDYKQSYSGVLEAISNGEIAEERIDESLHRIFRVKYKNEI